LRAFTLLGLLLALSANAAERPYIISGFDDVLRQAENTGWISAGLKIFEDDKGFAGMPELYGIISEGKKFSLVSAITSLLAGRVRRFLKDSKFPESEQYLRNWFTEWSIENFKTLRIEKIINEHPNRKFIIIFDNSNPSIAMAENLQKRFPGKILAVYLRQVVDKPLPKEATPFMSAFDIALSELRAGRFNTADAIKVGDAVAKEESSELVVPHYAFCSADFTKCDGTPSALTKACNGVRERIAAACKRP
jgi:hypothetical protein